jgi:hypothetical protein
MKRATALMVAAVIGCGDGTGPDQGRLKPFSGAYALIAIDDVVLPATIAVDGSEEIITSGVLEFLAANYLSVTINKSVAGDPIVLHSVAMSGFYRMATPDSAVFPTGPSPLLFLRRTGGAIVVVAAPAQPGTVPGAMLGGAHRFTFATMQSSAHATMNGTRYLQ